MDADRLMKQIEFIVEIDKLKSIVRQNLLVDGSRQEDSAEHSWHMAVMALVLSEHSRVKGIDLFRVLKMILVHDIVEIDAGDAYCYDDKANEGKGEREGVAADRIFGMLPEDQSREFRALWEEFDARKTPEAKFAAALDRLQPLLNNYRTHGRMWLKHGVRREKVIARNRPMEEGAPALWEFASEMIRDAVEKGWIAD